MKEVIDHLRSNFVLRPLLDQLFFDLYKYIYYTVDKFTQSLDRTEGSSTMTFPLGVPESNFDTQAHHDFFSFFRAV